MNQQQQQKKTATVLLNSKLCKNCGICEEFCPKDVFQWNQDSEVEVGNPENCIICRLCEMRCPDFAIFVQEIT